MTLKSRWSNSPYRVESVQRILCVGTIVSVLEDLNKSYMYRLFYECGKSYFGVKYLFDSTFVRFYFAKKDGQFIYKYRKASFNSREEIPLNNLDQKEFDKVVQCSRISLTYRYSYEHDKKIKSLEGK